MRRRRGRAEIEQLVAEFASSGLRPREFCAGRGLAVSTLHRYRQMGRRKPRSMQGEGGLVRVELAGRRRRKEGGGSLAVVLVSGRRIEVQPGFDGPTLERLVGVLERI